MGSEIQIAHYAVVTRTANVIDFLIPAAVLVPRVMLPQSRLSRSVAVSLITTTCCVAIMVVATPWIVDLYGESYTGLTPLFVLLFATQWLNGAGRPAIRDLAAHWNFALIRRILFVSMTAALVASFIGIPTYGALGAGVSVCLGALLLNGQAVQAAFARGIGRTG